MDAKTFKTAYILVALLVAVCAIVSSYLQHYYIAVGLIVLASAVMLLGAIYVSYLYRIERAKALEKL